MTKNDGKAVHFRRQGNQLYCQKDYDAALKKYNESICWAETASEDLGIGYANRSAVYYERKEYELVLANIALAKEHNYPQRMLAKLEARESFSKQQLSKSKNAKHQYHLKYDGEVNPRIPYLSKDVHVEPCVDMGMRIVADRDFQPGEVLLSQRPLLGSVAASHQYASCNYCARNFFHSLIPCPHCTSAMFCGEECLQKGWTRCHRFECGITTSKLYDVYKETDSAYIGPRLFFHGLSLFDDNVDKMMQFCQRHPRTGCNPFRLDYANYDPLEEFKVILTCRTRSKPALESQENQARVKFAANKYVEAYQTSSLVQSLFASKAKKRFMLHYFSDFIMTFPTCQASACLFSPAAWSFRYHYPDGNVKVYACNATSLVVTINTIPKGALVIMNDSTVNDLVKLQLNPPQRMVFGDFLTYIKAEKEGKALVNRITACSDDAISLTQLEEFMQKYSNLMRLSSFLPTVLLYATLLESYLDKRLKDEMRAEVMP